MRHWPEVSGDDLTASDDPTERVRQEKGKCEGRKPHSKLRPDAVALAKRLHRASRKTGKRMSLRKIAAALSEAGHLNEQWAAIQSQKHCRDGRRACCPG